MASRQLYTSEQLAFLQAYYMSATVAELTRAFNARYGLGKTEGQIKSTLKNHNITCGRKPANRLIPRTKLISPEQEQFIRKQYPLMGLPELTASFNERFGSDKGQNQIRAFIHNHGINSGRTGQFVKGQESWNLGKKGFMGANRTSFKKGDAPANRKPIGTERIDSKDGFVLVKIAERNPYTGAPTRYKHKHVHVWEQANGPVPEGHAVALKDGNKLNCALDNLMLLSRAELLTVNLHGYKDQPSEMKPIVLALAKLEAKAGFRTRPGRGRRKG